MSSETQSREAGIGHGSTKVPELFLRYEQQIEGQSRCFDRVIFQGTLLCL
jgi:hypothetical protein